MSFKYDPELSNFEFSRAVTRDSVRVEALQEANIAKLRRMITQTVSVVRSTSFKSIGSLKRRSESLSSFGSYMDHNQSTELIETDWTAQHHRTSKENMSARGNCGAKKGSSKKLAPKFSNEALDLLVKAPSHDRLVLMHSPAPTLATQAESTPGLNIKHKSLSLGHLGSGQQRSAMSSLSPVSFLTPGSESSSNSRRRQMQCFTPKAGADSDGEAMEEPQSEPPPPDEDLEMTDESDRDMEAHPSHSSSVDEPSPTLSRPTPSLTRQASLSMPAVMRSGAKSRPRFEDLAKNMSLAQLRSPRGLFQNHLPSKLRVFVTTFNTAGNMPRPSELHNWLPLDPEGLCDVIVVGLQECKSGNHQGRTELKAPKSSMRVRKASQDISLDELADQLDVAQFGTTQSRKQLRQKPDKTDPAQAPTNGSNTPDSDPPSLSRRKSLSHLFAKLTSPKPRAQTVHLSAREREAALQIGEQLDREALHATEEGGGEPCLHRQPSTQEAVMRIIKGKSKSVRLDKVNRSLLDQMIQQELRAVGDSEKNLDTTATASDFPSGAALRKTSSGGSMKRRGSGSSALKRAKNSFIASSKKQQIDNKIQQHYGPGYKRVACETLGDMKLLVLCRAGLKPHITSVKKTHKATGIGGVLGNKGGVMVKVKVGNTELCFLSCHLAAHESEDKVNRRNQDVHDILKAASNASRQHLDIAQRYHHTFLLGDLNYRINLGISDQQERDRNLHRLQVVKLIYNEDYESLYRADQLQREITANNVLRGFRETAPKFPPTFKVTQAKGLEYNLHRIPSYCDRILWASLPGLESKIEQNSYYAVDEVSCSDHKPVCSIFTIDNPGGYSATLDTHRVPDLSPRKSLMHLGGTRQSSKRYALRVSRVKALDVSDEIYSSPFLQLKLHSTVLASDMIVFPTPPGEQDGFSLVDMLFEVPHMAVKAHTPAQLLGKHLAISLWGDKKCKKLMGQCVLSLDAIASLSSSASIFHFPLLRYGVACGEISGVYELIEMEDRDSGNFAGFGKRITSTISKTVSGES